MLALAADVYTRYLQSQSFPTRGDDIKVKYLATHSLLAQRRSRNVDLLYYNLFFHQRSINSPQGYIIRGTLHQVASEYPCNFRRTMGRRVAHVIPNESQESWLTRTCGFGPGGLSQDGESDVIVGYAMSYPT